MRKVWVLAAVALLVVALLIPAVSIPQALGRRGDRVEVFKAAVVSVTNSSITVVREEASEELAARGRWLLLSGDAVKVALWDEAKAYIGEGEALMVAASIDRGNRTISVLLGLKQGDVVLARPALLKRWARRHVRTKSYIGVRGEIVQKGSNYLLIQRNGRKGLVIVGGRWLKAGEGEVEWSDVAEEFRVGDTIRVFCHNVLLMNREFSEVFGIDAVIWGYSGAIVDLTSGVTVSRA